MQTNDFDSARGVFFNETNHIFRMAIGLSILGIFHTCNLVQTTKKILWNWIGVGSHLALLFGLRMVFVRTQNDWRVKKNAQKKNGQNIQCTICAHLWKHTIDIHNTNTNKRTQAVSHVEVNVRNRAEIITKRLPRASHKIRWQI